MTYYVMVWYIVQCWVFFHFAGGSGGLDNIASDPLDSAKSFLQMSDLLTGPPRSPKGPAIMTGSAMTLN